MVSKIVRIVLEPKYFLIVVFVLFFTFLSVSRHYALKSYLHDLGTIDQTIWNTLNGDFFKTTSNLWQTGSYLGDHFSPILLLFVPFYAIGFKAEFLLFIQSLAIALAGIPIYEIARRKLKSKFWGLFFLVIYLSYPVVGNTLLYDFHLVSLAAFFLSFAFYFFYFKNEKLFLIFSLLAILCQEEIALVVFALSIYALFKKRFIKTSVFLAGFSLVWFVVVASFLIPYFNHSEYSALSRYYWLGSNTFSVFKNIIFKPAKILEFFSFQDHFSKYVFNLFFPLAFLPLLSPLILIALPILLANALSSNLMMSDISFYHSIAITPFLFFAAIYVFKKFKRKLFISFAIVLAALISVYWFSVTPFSSKYTFKDYQISGNAAFIEEIKKIVPQNVSLSVQHNLGPHFSEREKIYVFPHLAHESDYVLVDLFDPYLENPRQVFTFSYALQMNVKDWIGEIEKMFADKNYGIIYYEDGYFIFKRSARQDLNEAALSDFQARKKLFIKQ